MKSLGRKSEGARLLGAVAHGVERVHDLVAEIDLDLLQAMRAVVGVGEARVSQPWISQSIRLDLVNVEVDEPVVLELRSERRCHVKVIPHFIWPSGFGCGSRHRSTSRVRRAHAEG